MERIELGSAKPPRPTERLARISGMPDRLRLLRRRRNKHRLRTDHLPALGSADRAVRVVLHHSDSPDHRADRSPLLPCPARHGLALTLPLLRGRRPAGASVSPAASTATRSAFSPTRTLTMNSGPATRASASGSPRRWECPSSHRRATHRRSGATTSPPPASSSRPRESSSPATPSAVPARLLLLCVLLRGSWLTVQGDRHVGADGAPHRRGGRAAVAVSVGVAGGVPFGKSQVGSELPTEGGSISPMLAGRPSWLVSTADKQEAPPTATLTA